VIDRECVKIPRNRHRNSLVLKCNLFRYMTINNETRAEMRFDCCANYRHTTSLSWLFDYKYMHHILELLVSVFVCNHSISLFDLALLQ